MQFSDNTLLRSEGVFYPSLLRDVKLGSHPLQPFWEAFTNALESITDRPDKKDAGKIVVKLHYSGDLLDGKNFELLVVEDTGIGFNDQEFERFLTYKDDRKGHNNRGSGRFQLVHAFSTCEYESVYKFDHQYYQRKFHISARANYLKENAIAFLEYTKAASTNDTGTKLTMLNLKNPKTAAALNIDLGNFKDQIVAHYIQYFCVHRDSLPQIVLQSYVNGQLSQEEEIMTDDIPQIDSTETIELPYQKYDALARKFNNSKQKEPFTIKAFKIPAHQLKTNAIKLTSKDEIVENDEHQLSLNVISL